MNSLNINDLLEVYRTGATTPVEIIKEISLKCENAAEDNIWIYRLSEIELAPYLKRLNECDPNDLPLYGVPFAVKDNIDLAGIPTTAACQEYTYTPTVSATVVDKLVCAGAIPIGKTNLDQFATGLNGTRSPWGPVRNSVNQDYISGGSSSGSAVAVAKNLVSFALGTDTAGSGRVPASFNNLVGLKPSKGLLSTKGVVPACRSIDCVTVFASTVSEAEIVFEQAKGFDPEDPFSREKAHLEKPMAADFFVGIPRKDQLEFFGDQSASQLFELAKQRIEQVGGRLVEVDFAPFQEAAELLYQGPWVAERYAAIENLVSHNPECLLPVIRDIIAPAVDKTAVETFKSQYRLQDLKKVTDAILGGVDCLLLPTAPTIYTISEMLNDPITLNSRLGYYTNFMNLLDYAGIAIPSGQLENGLPWGITLCGPAFSDSILVKYAQRFLDENVSTKNDDCIDVMVCGAHLSGMPLNGQLLERKATLLTATKTAPRYRFYALAGGPPFRPGLIRDEASGTSIEVEVWRMPIQYFGSFMQLIPHPLGIGTVELESGDWCKGFICEPSAVLGAQEITELGGWRQFIATTIAT